MCRHRPLRYCEIFCETGILAPVEEWGHFVAASRKIGNFDKWVVIGWRSRMSRRGEVREIICKSWKRGGAARLFNENVFNEHFAILCQYTS